MGVTFSSFPSTGMLPGVSSVCEYEICWEFRKSPQLQVVKVFTESSPGFGPEVAVYALQAGPCLPDKQEREVAPEDLISATIRPLLSPTSTLQDDSATLLAS